MEWKNLHFLWKQFLSNYNLPNIIYSNTLKNIIKEKYSYDEISDSFIYITSKYIPVHSDFIKFWEGTITQHCLDSELSIDVELPDSDFLSNSQILTDNELEIDEICSLFKFWSKQKTEDLLSNGNISEENVLKILKHFFPEVKTIEDKFVLHVTCSLWNKIGDINTSFTYIKQQVINNYKLALISFDDIYNFYYKFCSNNSLKFIVSKRYFEKHLYYKFLNHVVYEKFIETEWLIANI
jgi:hypothetical protein